METLTKFLESLLLEGASDLIVKHKDFYSLPKEQQDWLLAYFKNRKQPPNMIIRWEKINDYDIQEIYNATLEKSKTGLKKAVKRQGIEGLTYGEDYLTLKSPDPNYVFYIPLHWNASKLIASKRIGGCEGKWCTAYQKDKSYWDKHTAGEGSVLIYIIKKDRNSVNKYIAQVLGYSISLLVVRDEEDEKVTDRQLLSLVENTLNYVENVRIIREAYDEILKNKAKDDASELYSYEIYEKVPVESSTALYKILKNIRVVWERLERYNLNKEINRLKRIVENLNVSTITSLNVLFSDYSFSPLDLTKWDTSNVKSLDFTFSDCSSYIDISEWNTSNVISMEGTFSRTGGNFNPDISKWDTSQVTRMSGLFKNSSFNGDISKWNVSNVMFMDNMFEHSEFNSDISNWDVSNVLDMSYMFHRSKFNGDISNWNVSKVTYMDYMFKDSSFDGDISNWDVSNVQSAVGIFSGSPLEKRYPNGLEDLKKEQQKKKESSIKLFLNNNIWRDV